MKAVLLVAVVFFIAACGRQEAAVPAAGASSVNKVVYALYGADTRQENVTGQVQKLIDARGEVQSTPESMELPDPAFGTVKALNVELEMRGQSVRLGIVHSGKFSVVPGAGGDAEKKIEVIKGEWGADSRVRDVTATLQALIDDGKVIGVDGGSLQKDPAFGTVKTLNAEIRVNGDTLKLSLPDGSRFRFSK